MLKTNLRGQIRQTHLPKWKPLLPLFEAVMNAVQAAQEAPGNTHKVTIALERERELIGDDDAPVHAFTVTDTGAGFNDDNFDSFNTAFSEYKLTRGGRGLGRFIWLKAFDRVEIDSFFVEPDVDGPLQRRFVFDANYDPDNVVVHNAESPKVGTAVRLAGFREPYKGQCPKSVDQIVQRLIEHFLLVFFHPRCPQIHLIDGGEVTSLNETFQKNFRSSASENPFELKGIPFELYGFRLSAPRASKHRLVYAANDRGVVSDNLEDFIPNLSGRLSDEHGNSFIYLAVVRGSYLDDRVNYARTDFDMAETDDAEATQPSLLADEIRRSEIREACVERISHDLSDVMEEINTAKKERIRQYVQDDAPQYKVLMRHVDQFIDRIPPSGSKLDLDTALHRELHTREVALKREGARMITEAAKLDDYEAYQEKLSKFMEEYNELGVSALAQHVMHRRIVIDLLEKAISINVDTDKYPLEKGSMTSSFQ